MLEVLGDPEIMTYIEPPFDMDRVREFIQKAGMGEPPAVYAAENDEGEFVGYVIYHEYGEDGLCVFILYSS